MEGRPSNGKCGRGKDSVSLSSLQTVCLQHEALLFSCGTVCPQNVQTQRVLHLLPASGNMTSRSEKLVRDIHSTLVHGCDRLVCSGHIGEWILSFLDSSRCCGGFDRPRYKAHERKCSRSGRNSSPRYIPQLLQKWTPPLRSGDEKPATRDTTSNPDLVKRNEKNVSCALQYWNISY